MRGSVGSVGVGMSCVHMSAVLEESRRVSDPLELGLQLAVSCQVQVLRTELLSCKSSADPSLQPQALLQCPVEEPFTLLGVCTLCGFLRGSLCQEVRLCGTRAC